MQYRHSIDSIIGRIRTPVSIVLLGASAVGKTTLLRRFLTSEIVSEHEPTIEDCYFQNVRMEDGIDHPVRFVDTSGTHHFTAMRKFNITGATAFILVYDCSRSETLRFCEIVRKEIEEMKGEETFSCLLVANKADLLNRAEKSATNDGNGMMVTVQLSAVSDRSIIYEVLSKFVLSVVRQHIKQYKTHLSHMSTSRRRLAITVTDSLLAFSSRRQSTAINENQNQQDDRKQSQQRHPSNKKISGFKCDLSPCAIM